MSFWINCNLISSDKGTKLIYIEDCIALTVLRKCLSYTKTMSCGTKNSDGNFLIEQSENDFWNQ